MKRRVLFISFIFIVTACLLCLVAFIGWYIHNELIKHAPDHGFFVFLTSFCLVLVLFISVVYSNFKIRKKVIMIVRRGEEWAETIFSAAPDAVILINDKGKIVKWNPKAETLFGWMASEVIDKPLSQVIIPERYREAHENGIQHFLKTGTGPVLGKTVEVHALHKNNLEFDVALSISPTLVDGKHLFIGFVRDITEKKIAEKKMIALNESLENMVAERTGKLKTSENLYSSLFHHMPIGFAYCEAIYTDHELTDYTYLAVNKEYETLTTLDGLSGKKISAVMPGLLASDPGYVNIISRVLASGTAEIFETYVPLMNKWLSITLYSPAAGFFVGLVEDITRRTQSQENLRQSEIRLKEAQSIAHLCSWDIDLITRVHQWSDEFYKIYGIEKSETSPSDKLFLGLMHPDDISFAEEKMKIAFETCIDSTFEFRFIRKDGQLRIGCTEWKFEFDAQGKPLRIFGILQDITERKNAEANLKILEQKILDQKIQEQKKIARAIIKAQEKERNHIAQELHDNINQILAATKMYIGIAGNKDAETKAALQYPMELVDTSMQEIRILCHKMVTPLQDIHLDELIGELLTKFDKGTHVKTNFHYSVPKEFLSDDMKLNIYRIVQEQTSNISKYAEAQEVNVSITKESDSIQVTISDDGRGFDTNSKRSGIGISNMINRIQSFNGKIKITSAPGQGCLTLINMPCGVS